MFLAHGGHRLSFQQDKTVNIDLVLSTELSTDSLAHGLLLTSYIVDLFEELHFRLRH